MARARFIALAVVLASLPVVFADCSSAPLVVNIDAPYIYYVEIVPNPVNAGDTVTFILSWRDNFRSMGNPKLRAFVYTDAEDMLVLPTDNMAVAGGRRPARSPSASSRKRNIKASRNSLSPTPAGAPASSMTPSSTSTTFRRIRLPNNSAPPKIRFHPSRG